MYVDGSKSQKGSAAGIILRDPYGNQTSVALRIYYAATNNEAEYEAMLAGLKLVIALKEENVIVKSYSQLVVNKVKWRVPFKTRKHGKNTWKK